MVILHVALLERLNIGISDEENVQRGLLAIIPEISVSLHDISQRPVNSQHAVTHIFALT